MPSLMLRRTAPLAFTALLSLASTAPAEDRSRDTHAAPAARTMFTARAFGGVVAPNARLAGLFDAGGAPIRTKGVLSIQRIDVGVYCIRPSAAANINVNTIIPALSVDYFYSERDEIQVQWASTQSGCGAGRIGVYTFANTSLASGNYVFSNDVGFLIVVP